MAEETKNVDLAIQEMAATMALWEPARDAADTLVDHYCRILFEIEADEVGAEARYVHICDAVKAAFEAKMNELARRQIKPEDFQPPLRLGMATPLVLHFTAHGT